jgi:hypothetical protein
MLPTPRRTSPWGSLEAIWPRSRGKPFKPPSKSWLPTCNGCPSRERSRTLLIRQAVLSRFAEARGGVASTWVTVSFPQGECGLVADLVLIRARRRHRLIASQHSTVPPMDCTALSRTVAPSSQRGEKTL